MPGFFRLVALPCGLRWEAAVFGILFTWHIFACVKRPSRFDFVSKKVGQVFFETVVINAFKLI